MNGIAILTAIYDEYDELKPVVAQTGFDVDWVFVTDQPGLPEQHLGWRVVYDPRPDQHPNRAAKHPKCTPWEYTDRESSIWIDGSFRIMSNTFAAEALSFADPIAQFVHPWRDCIFDEAAVSVEIPKYGDEPVVEQLDHYRELGHPEHWGLWATGVIARHHDEDVRAFGKAWLEETYFWSFQDQISEPVVLREQRLRPTLFPGTHLATPWLAYEGSGRH